MNSSSLATSGVSGAAVVCFCWAVQTRWNVALPDYVTAALVTLASAATHAVAASAAWFAGRTPAAKETAHA